MPTHYFCSGKLAASSQVVLTFFLIKYPTLKLEQAINDALRFPFPLSPFPFPTLKPVKCNDTNMGYDRSFYYSVV